MALSQADMTTTRPPYSQWLRSTNNITQQFLSLGGQTDIISLAGGLPAAELYPVEAIAAASQRALLRFGPEALEYGPVEGFAPLRASIAARMSRESGRSIAVENVLLTTGSMQGLALLGKAFIDPGDLIVAQFPTYLGALDGWRPRHPVYAKLTQDLDRPGLRADLARAKFAYCVPNYSNPTGVLVSQTDRARLLDLVLDAGTWLVEDDPYLPLQLDGAAGPSILAAHGRIDPTGPYQGPVIYMGTLSKSIVPGLRVGWMVGEAKLIQILALAKQSSDLSSSMFTQAVAHDLLESGLEADHVPKTVAAYRERRDALCAAAREQLSEWFTWEVPSGGMFVWMRALNPGIDTNALYSFALAEKVAFVPSSVFDPLGELRSAMRLNFTRNDPERLIEGVARLARAIRRYLAA